MQTGARILCLINCLSILYQRFHRCHSSHCWAVFKYPFAVIYCIILTINSTELHSSSFFSNQAWIHHVEEGRRQQMMTEARLNHQRTILNSYPLERERKWWWRHLSQKEENQMTQEWRGWVKKYLNNFINNTSLQRLN